MIPDQLLRFVLLLRVPNVDTLMTALAVTIFVVPRTNNILSCCVIGMDQSAKKATLAWSASQVDKVKIIVQEYVNW